tara:strand:+ start:156 stop:431 length:276 start_codon:yes stop_codon:yes gene_type:complete
MEALQKLSDPPLSVCPACGASELKKQISAVGFRLSGTGWYETDFKTKDKRNISGEREPSGGDGPKVSDAGKPEKDGKKVSEPAKQASEPTK